MGSGACVAGLSSSAGVASAARSARPPSHCCSPAHRSRPAVRRLTAADSRSTFSATKRGRAPTRIRCDYCSRPIHSQQRSRTGGAVPAFLSLRQPVGRRRHAPDLRRRPLSPALATAECCVTVLAAARYTCFARAGSCKAPAPAVVVVPIGCSVAAGCCALSLRHDRGLCERARLLGPLPVMK